MGPFLVSQSSRVAQRVLQRDDLTIRRRETQRLVAASSRIASRADGMTAYGRSREPGRRSSRQLRHDEVGIDLVEGSDEAHARLGLACADRHRRETVETCRLSCDRGDDVTVTGSHVDAISTKLKFGNGRKPTLSQHRGP